MNPIRIAGLLLLMMAPTAQALKLDLNLSNDSARLAVSDTARAGEESRLETSISAMFNDDDVRAATLGFHLVGDSGAQEWPTSIGIGVQATFVDAGDFAADTRGGSLAVGGLLRFRFPHLNRLGFAARVHYAPDIVSFGDVEQWFEWAARFEYEILRDANIYIGYRQLSVDLDDVGNGSLDNGWHGGIEYGF